MTSSKFNLQKIEDATSYVVSSQKGDRFLFAMKVIISRVDLEDI